MEIWKDVVGFESYYQVSNYGRIRCKEVEVNYNDGHVQLKRPRIMLGCKRNGYHNIDVKIDGVRSFHAVHRWVAKAFVDNPDDKEDVNHINGDRLDNIPSNLEWVTHKENVIHAVNTGLRKTRPIHCFDLNGNYIMTHRNIHQAAKYIGKPNSSTNIRKCAQGKRLHAYNYKWSYDYEGSTTISEESTL